VLGERVKLKTHRLVEGRRRFDGQLQAVDEDSVTVDVDGEAYRLAFGDIAKARLVPDYDELKREL
jgi:ribosome maturation factor RimP